MSVSYCKQCKIKKTPNNTHLKGNGRWLNTYCIQCEREIGAATNRHKAEILRRFKRMKGCSHCGYKENGYALQFDHLHGKTLSAGQGFQTLGHKRLREELSKCRILCARCHMIHTHDPKGLQ